MKNNGVKCQKSTFLRFDAYLFQKSEKIFLFSGLN